MTWVFEKPFALCINTWVFGDAELELHSNALPYIVLFLWCQRDALFFYTLRFASRQSCSRLRLTLFFHGSRLSGRVYRLVI
ncbi:Uncharacterised protein [Vibrio cholerae]|nr:Uncharacterised protein [Vibrio cholerae]